MIATSVLLVTGCSTCCKKADASAQPVTAACPGCTNHLSITLCPGCTNKLTLDLAACPGCTNKFNAGLGCTNNLNFSLCPGCTNKLSVAVCPGCTNKLSFDVAACPGCTNKFSPSVVYCFNNNMAADAAINRLVPDSFFNRNF